MQCRFVHRLNGREGEMGETKERQISLSALVQGERERGGEGRGRDRKRDLFTTCGRDAHTDRPTGRPTDRPTCACVRGSPSSVPSSHPWSRVGAGTCELCRCSFAVARGGPEGGESVCVCVCVCERDREGGSEGAVQRRAGQGRLGMRATF